MVGLAELKPLQVRKEELIAQSEGNRRALDAECGKLRTAAASVGRGLSFLREARPAWFVAMPVLGFLLARKWRQVGRLATNVISGWRILQTVRTIWRDFKDKPDT